MSYEYTTEALFRFAHRYARLGSSIQEQFDKLIDGDFDDLNPNAVRIIREYFDGDFTDEIDKAIADYYEWKKDNRK